MEQALIILYVEDDILSRKVMEVILGVQMGIERFTIFEDSEDFSARLLALSPPPNLIFLDIHMRPLNGFDMLEVIRHHPEYQHTTVVALTASVMNEEIAELQTSGFDGAIAKPLNREIFPELVAQILAGERVWYVA